MSVPKIFLIMVVSVFSILGVLAYVKKSKHEKTTLSTSQKRNTNDKPAYSPVISVPNVKAQDNTGPSKDDLPSIDRIFQLFSHTGTKLPIVETLTYNSSVPWLKGRPAWIADYAAYYNTSRHFIARSLNGKPDYFNQSVSSGKQFNVFRKDKKIQFHLLVDVSRLKMGFYYVDLDTNERVLLKTYKIGLGRLATNKPSGTLTPIGSYTLGDKIAIYKPGVVGFFQEQKTEMIRVFGTRWIPFDLSLEGATEPAKGYGIQGAPWVVDAKTGQLVENIESIGKYESDGCVRMLKEDIEELFSIVITKPAYVHIVKDFHEAKLPGKEVGTPTR